MVQGDALFLALLLIAVLNGVRCISSLKSLLVVMRDAHPMLYLQVDGRGFFSTHANYGKQVRLVGYLISRQYQGHHDSCFVTKCDKVRQLFLITIAMFTFMLFGIPLLSWIGL
ncbi:Universal stress protein B [Vibrio stylophorae]|uniref:Universal stress protein B n=1 Tax=Vibrio stylophorae TaxID=659351 RepID=A0ABM8ZPJ4_9VIBR|nr:universal stress protein UspB [Vibrio stylophorae]CAH0532232.1 Universal stress protein B [Vibrio stylophorae]